jgi:Immunity protein 27
MSIETQDFELTDATTAIQGFWLDLGSKVVKDSGWIRIEWLIDNRLVCIAQKDEETGLLYRNPSDDKLWHFYLVSPGLQNGGPPALTQISKDKAHDLFGEFPS